MGGWVGGCGCVGVCGCVFVGVCLSCMSLENEQFTVHVCNQLHCPARLQQTSKRREQVFRVGARVFNSNTCCYVYVHACTSLYNK